jgi:hypothetical protein
MAAVYTVCGVQAARGPIWACERLCARAGTGEWAESPGEGGGVGAGVGGGSPELLAMAFWGIPDPEIEDLRAYVQLGGDTYDPGPVLVVGAGPRGYVVDSPMRALGMVYLRLLGLGGRKVAKTPDSVLPLPLARRLWPDEGGAERALLVVPEHVAPPPSAGEAGAGVPLPAPEGGEAEDGAPPSEGGAAEGGNGWTRCALSMEGWALGSVETRDARELRALVARAGGAAASLGPSGPGDEGWQARPRPLVAETAAWLWGPAGSARERRVSALVGPREDYLPDPRPVARFSYPAELPEYSGRRGYVSGINGQWEVRGFASGPREACQWLVEEIARAGLEEMTECIFYVHDTLSAGAEVGAAILAARLDEKAPPEDQGEMGEAFGALLLGELDWDGISYDELAHLRALGIGEEAAAAVAVTMNGDTLMSTDTRYPRLLDHYLACLNPRLGTREETGPYRAARGRKEADLFRPPGSVAEELMGPPFIAWRPPKQTAAGGLGEAAEGDGPVSLYRARAGGGDAEFLGTVPQHAAEWLTGTLLGDGWDDDGNHYYHEPGAPSGPMGAPPPPSHFGGALLEALAAPRPDEARGLRALAALLPPEGGETVVVRVLMDGAEYGLCAVATPSRTLLSRYLALLTRGLGGPRLVAQATTRPPRAGPGARWLWGPPGTVQSALASALMLP